MARTAPDPTIDSTSRCRAAGRRVVSLARGRPQAAIQPNKPRAEKHARPRSRAATQHVPARPVDHLKSGGNAAQTRVLALPSNKTVCEPQEFGAPSGRALEHAGNLPPVLYPPGDFRRLSRRNLALHSERRDAQILDRERCGDECGRGRRCCVPQLTPRRTRTRTERGDRQQRRRHPEQSLDRQQSREIIGIDTQLFELIALCVVRLLS
jgi:hypothetical protein